MFARLLAALCCLLNTALCFDRPDPVSPPRREIVVYLKNAAAQPAQSIEEMKRETSALMETGGYRIAWRDVASSTSEVDDASLMLVELRGICKAPGSSSTVPPLTESASLASTAIVDGEILPFSWLECDTLSRLLAPALERYSGRHDYLYGRAMGRLIAHELFHVLTKTRDHEGAGVGKPYFSAQDILAEHFEFEFTTLAKLEAAGDEVDEVPSSDDAFIQAGR